MSRLAFALVFAITSCTPDDEPYPILPASGGVQARSGMVSGSGGGTTNPDAGNGGTGGGGDAGARDGGIHDSGPFLDGPPPDASALLPDSATAQVP